MAGMTCPVCRTTRAGRYDHRSTGVNTSRGSLPRDPQFAIRAAVVLDLYQGFYKGEPLAPGDRILSVDAKSSIQAHAGTRVMAEPGPR
jgi:hypothetical protein